MPIPKSPINPLDDLYNLIEKGKIQKTVVYQRKTYTFRSLNDEDYTWRDQFVNMNGALVMYSSIRSPTLAVATVMVDGVPVEQIPGLDTLEEVLPQAVQERVQEASKYLLAYNLHTRLYSQLPREYLEGLYDEYLKVVETPAQTVATPEAIKNF